MMQDRLGKNLKLAAIDLDGTLLGPDHQISAENFHAVQQLQAAGLQVVLASGRHYTSMRKYAKQLPGVQWVVSCQGGETSDVERGLILNREFLPVNSVRTTLELGRTLGLSSMVYAVEGVLSEPAPHSALDFYTDLSGHPPRQSQIADLVDLPIFKIIWIGENAKDIDQAMESLNTDAIPLQTVRTHARLLEFMPQGVSKATALKVLARRLSLDAAEIVAFGDGDNDVPMFEWAGLSVAMPHGWPAALRRATYTAPAGPAETAFARGVELVFESRLGQNREKLAELAGAPR